MLAPRMTPDQNCLEKFFGASSKNPIVASAFHSAVGMLPLVYTGTRSQAQPFGLGCSTSVLVVGCWLLAYESRDLSLAGSKITLVKS